MSNRIAKQNAVLRGGIEAAIRDLGTEIALLGGACTINLASVRRGLQICLEAAGPVPDDAETVETVYEPQGGLDYAIGLNAEGR